MQCHVSDLYLAVSFSWSSQRSQLRTIILCFVIVYIEHGGTASDKRKELTNSLSGNHEVNLDDDLQGIVTVRHWGRGWGVLSAASACAVCMCMLCCRHFQVHTHLLSYLPVYPTLIVQSREFQLTQIEHAHGVVYVALRLTVYVKPK